MDTVYVALLLPYSDGSGDVSVLGVYSTRVDAEARCWRTLKRLGYEEPTEVVETLLDPPYREIEQEDATQNDRTVDDRT